MSSNDKPTPSVPPTDFTRYETGKGSRVIETKHVETCDCGGDIVDETIATGRMVVGMWDAEHFDPDEYQLSEEWKETESRVRCTRCGAGWSY
ncbi:hypothetical protein [Haloferax chudinovii]|uniref:Small CPxCG-related zinc finger protein n=1 Tax=Haloferax chudinovii TaxID=1109010 RepID=A0ABD5XF57_9EURY